MNTKNDISGRLGLDVPAEWWPAAPSLKAQEAAGFAWVQLQSPPMAMLRDQERSTHHAQALRRVLDVCGLRLIVHGPGELMLGDPGHDAAFVSLLHYAELAGAELVVVHGANVPLGLGRTADLGEDRLRAEERSLRRLAPRAEAAGLTVAVENLAPVYPGAPRHTHRPERVAELVAQAGSPAVGMLLDLGHAHITCELQNRSLLDVVAAVRDQVVLFHVHDNHGARRGDEPIPGIVPLRLDLHLPPGQGTLPWREVAPLLSNHRAPLQLEVRPPYRPAPARLATVTAGLLELEPVAA